MDHTVRAINYWKGYRRRRISECQTQILSGLPSGNVCLRRRTAILVWVAMRSALAVMHPGAAVVLGRRLEFAIEFLLLLRSQQGAHAGARLKDGFAALTLKLFAQVHHLGAGFVHDCEDLVVLRGRQLQLTLNPLDKRSARNP